MKFEIYSGFDTMWKLSMDEIPAENKDVYYLQEWYQTWLEYEVSEAQCIHAEIDGYEFLYPFLKRKISKYDLQNTYYDIQTAYGYGGIIVNSDKVPEDIVSKLNNLIDEFLHDNFIIAEFIRVHPLLDSIKRTAEYSLVRKNVFVQTNESYKIPHKQARQNIVKAKSFNLEIQIDNDLKYLDEFINLYQLTAQRLKMSDYYWFDNDYFYKVRELLRGKNTLIHILCEGMIIASGLLVFYNEKASLHLAASNDKYFNMRPNDMLYHAAIQYSIENKIQFLNLGGGLTPDLNDNLFRFKSKYSDFHKDVFVGKKIINPEIYHKVTQEWALIHPELTEKYGNFFLKYRQEV